MIGELINKFENLEKQTVETFNELFPNSPITGYDNECELEIGELANTTRKITINGESFYHEMKNLEETTASGHSKEVNIYDQDRNFLGNFKSATSAYYSLNLGASTFYDRVRKGKLIMEEVI